MFDLNQAIGEWRRKMLAAGIKTPVPMEELESHLRDEIEERIRRGLSAELAFELAVCALGETGRLKTEFNKIPSATIRKHMLKILIILTALFGSVLGGALILPVLGRWHHTGVLVVQPLILGGTLACLAGAAVFYSVRKYQGTRGRNIISAGIVAAGGFYVVPLIQAFLQPSTDRVGWLVCLGLALASALFFGTCFRMNRRSAAVARGC